ncbi:MAG: G5 domain-containing protein [Firmicutes bacterium]|nr:G5 domain-containing protein [Candidatus Fermentithermobacillaceae bacterium]
MLPDRVMDVTTAKETVGQLLTELGIIVGTADAVNFPMDERLKDGMTVSVSRGRPVFVRADGRTRAFLSSAATVAEVLAQAGISLGPDDYSDPGPDEPVPDDRYIRVVRVTFREEVVTENIPFTTEYVKDPQLEAGLKAVRRNGQSGVANVRYMVKYEDGIEVSRKEISRATVKKPVSKLVALGTKTEVSREGTVIRFVRAIEVLATGYCPCEICCGKNADGYTYTGVPAKRGVIAVDPRVIPLGSRVYVDGYGFAVAADVGSAIKGNRIDVCFDTHQEALRWGVKKVKVYILPN